ncbi:MAG: hypothetical protein H6538_01185 [Bacteroidales bacterium]|nr:hypothetical protein [Bacteroidales bacterium]MCB8999834.1 hypothetical protein [Bacteroidales bacterium]MCB9012656.1 hypothetical protein [Bacteroidales bacterium]
MKDLKNTSNRNKKSKGDVISRKEAIQKAGLIAFSAATTMLLLSKPEKLQAQDSPVNPDDPDTW